MKRLRHMALGLVLILSLTTSAFAAEVPENLVVENLNGQQRMVKTYVLAPDADPDTLKEPSFDYDGFHYTWAYTTKEEQPYMDTKTVTETVTVETAKNDLSQILGQLAPSIAYDQDGYTGELALDHTSGYSRHIWQMPCVPSSLPITHQHTGGIASRLGSLPPGAVLPYNLCFT